MVKDIPGTDHVWLVMMKACTPWFMTPRTLSNVVSTTGPMEPDSMVAGKTGMLHQAVPHGYHVDYLVDGHLHHPHSTHCDHHGSLEVVAGAP
jgi:hypothetical protein